MTQRRPMRRGGHLTMSWSINTQTLNEVDDFAEQHGLRGYTDIMRLLVKYGLLYNKQLKDEANRKAKEKAAARMARIKAKAEAEAKPKKKGKRKAPSK